MKLENSKLLLIGGAGLVGSHICDQLLKTAVKEIVILDNFVRGSRDNLSGALDDSRVKVIEGDIRNRSDILAATKGVDGVFLLSALWLLQCAENPEAAVEVNLLGNFNVLEACRQNSIKRIVYSSSASVYGNALIQPMPENHELNNRTFYGATKVALEQMLRSYYEMYKIPYVALRYFNIYGPRQDYKNAYVSVIMKVLDRIDKGLPPIISGDGSQSYDFISVLDVARANILAMESDVTDEAFNICTGTKTSINQLVNILLKLTHSDLKPEHQITSQVFVTDRVGDPKKAKELINFEAQHSLADGLMELIRWRAERIRDDS